MQDDNFLKQKAREYPRITALLFAALGAFIFYLSFWHPLQELETGEPKVEFSVGGSVFGILTILIATVFIFTGNRFAFVITAVNQGRQGKYKYLFIGFFMLVGALSYFLLERYLNSKGYRLE